jgi:omega-6 fatty acid desaturase (delta-12 desaturase)
LTSPGCVGYPSRVNKIKWLVFCFNILRGKRIGANLGGRIEESQGLSAIAIESEPGLAHTTRAVHELDRQLLIDSRRYASEQIGKSWWHFSTTLLALAISSLVAGLSDPLWLRLLASLVTGLVLVRVFIVYHDYQHQAMFKNSPVARGLLTLYGYVMLTPPSVWRRSHDHHHRHNSKLFGASIGSFPIMTTESFAAASPREQLEYRIARSPWIIVLGYLTVFTFGMCVRPFLLDPRRHWDAPLSLVVHAGLFSLLWLAADWQTALLVFAIPTFIASALGAYLFYIQHNFPEAKIRRGEEWSYTQAALRSSSYLKAGPIMHWFTGNIGYHHVHHLNAKIPFYRLPEAMAGLAPLQSPAGTSLSLKDILGCLRLKLWDTQRDRFVSFAEARQNSAI